MSHHRPSIIFEDIVAPRSRFYQGPFGRLFRNLPPQVPAGGEKELIKLALEEMLESVDEGEANELDNSEIPAGYIYFGQFVGHDITFDPTSSLQRRNDPNMLRNFRTPRFDLDNLYGRGSDDMPFMYNQEKKINDDATPFLLVGNVADSDEPDLPRNAQGRALIGDMRNDENIIISQLQLAFIKFHNQVVADLAAKDPQAPGTRLFAEAQRIVRWHYQWVVVHDFLKRIVGEETYNRVLPNPDKDPHKPNLKFYDWKDQPFIPVEFSVAAYRFGHSMVRFNYALSDKLETEMGAGRIPIFDPNAGPLGDLRGFRPLPPGWSIQWNRFLEISDDDGYLSVEPQKSRRIDTKLAQSLKDLPFLSAENPPELRALGVRNLLRGLHMELPSGQVVARAMGFPIPPTLDPTKDDPLWYYILKEAGIPKEEGGGGGNHLGPVGGTIVAEVFLGLLSGDPFSYLNVDPLWTPANERSLDTIKEAAENVNDFQLRDIVRYAGMPLFEIKERKMEWNEKYYLVVATYDHLTLRKLQKENPENRIMARETALKLFGRRVIDEAGNVVREVPPDSSLTELFTFAGAFPYLEIPDTDPETHPDDEERRDKYLYGWVAIVPEDKLRVLEDNIRCPNSPFCQVFNILISEINPIAGKGGNPSKVLQDLQKDQDPEQRKERGFDIYHDQTPTTWSP